jgi:hypothetical protein
MEIGALARWRREGEREVGGSCAKSQCAVGLRVWRLGRAKEILRWSGTDAIGVEMGARRCRTSSESGHVRHARMGNGAEHIATS